MSYLDEIIKNIKNNKLDYALELCKNYENDENKHIIFNLRGVIFFSKNDLNTAENNFLNSFRIKKNFIDIIRKKILKNLFFLLKN